MKFFVALLMGISSCSDIGMGFAASVKGSEVNGFGKGKFHHGEKEEKAKRSKRGSEEQRLVDRRLGNYSCYRLVYLGKSQQSEFGAPFERESRSVERLCQAGEQSDSIASSLCWKNSCRLSGGAGDPGRPRPTLLLL